MKTFIIYPTHIRGYHAPGIAVDAASYSSAITIAKTLSRLSSFPNVWTFM